MDIILKLKNANKFNICIILILLLIVISNIIVLLTPITKYSADIFTSQFPELLLYSCVLIGSFLLLIFSIKKSTRTMILVVSLIIIAIITRLITIFILSIEGRTGMFLGDVQTIVGYARDIVDTGNILYFQYPLSGILMAVISTMTALDVTIVGTYISGTFVIGYVTAIYSLSKRLFDNRFIALISMFVAIIIHQIAYFNIYAGCIPMGMTLLQLPLSFYILCNILTNNHVKISALLFAISTIPSALYHPAAALFSIIFFVFVVLIFSIFHKKWTSKNTQFFGMRNVCLTISLIIGELTLLVTWVILVYDKFWLNLRILASELLTHTKADINNSIEIADKLSKSGLDVAGIGELAIKMYAPRIFLLIIGLLSIIYIYRHRDDIYNSSLLIGVGSVTVIAGFFYGLSLIGGSGTSSLAFQRMEFYLTLLIPIFVGYLVYTFLVHKESTLRKVGVIMLILLCISCPISIIGSISSPYTNQLTSIAMPAEYDSYYWLDVYGKNGYEHPSVTTKNYRYYNQLFGESQTKYLNTEPLPDHFGYHKVSHIDELDSITSSNSYVSLLERDIIRHLDIFKNIGRYDSVDIIHINYDKSVDKVYSNMGSVDIYFV